MARKKKATQNFKQLQKHWYDKLAKSGFEDIEWANGQDSRFLKQHSIPDALHYESQLLYYSMATAYLQDYQGLRGADRFLWKLHAAGGTYDELLAAYNAKYPEISMYTLYYRVQKLADKCRLWNRRNPKGCLYEDPE